jgi:hypothetical protein
MANEIIFLAKKSSKGGYTAKALQESIFTEGATLSDLKLKIREAIETHFYSADSLSKVIKIHYFKKGRQIILTL